MKIAYIGQKGIPAKFGGVETHVEELAKRMAQKGHEVFVYSRKNYTRSESKLFQGVNIVNLPSIPTKHLDAISHTFFSALHALFQGYDVIHFHSIGPSLLSFIPRILLRKTLIVGTYHCQDYYHKKWGVFARLSLRLGEWMICHAPNRTIAVSKILKNLIKNKFDREAVYIPNGTNVEKVSNSDRLEKWGLKKDGYVLSVSRLIRHKGIHYLIQSFLELEKKGLAQGKKLVIVGDGFHTDEYVRNLKKLAEKSRNIIFTGNLTGENLRQIFSHAFIFVQPSETEGLSIALLEALRYELPVLVSDIPENLEAIGEGGLSFECSNSQNLLEKLERLFEDRNLRENFRKKAGEIARKKYDWEKITDSTEEIYAHNYPLKKRNFSWKLNYE